MKPDQMSAEDLSASVKSAANFVNFHGFHDHAEQLAEAARRLAARVEGDAPQREPSRGLHRAWDIATIGEGNDDLILEHNKLFTAYLDAAPTATADDEPNELGRLIGEQYHTSFPSRFAFAAADAVLAAGYRKHQVVAEDVAAFAERAAGFVLHCGGSMSGTEIAAGIRDLAAGYRKRAAQGERPLR